MHLSETYLTSSCSPFLNKSASSSDMNLGSESNYIIIDGWILQILMNRYSIPAYHRILLLEGIYSQIEFVYPKFRTLLITKFDEFGVKLDNMRITNPETAKRVKFFRYDRILLGDTVAEDKNGTPWISSYMKFKDRCENDDKVKSWLQPAREFVENLPFSSASELDTLMSDLKYILNELEQKTEIHIQR